ncbi:hypothetical protein CSV79_13115 [Sporosarcina sp. P13]|uniref:hypothetical protein n=1 Tax=Sporosarcina sp. P13 TaxID=2048263 RepID=UPI000C167D9B|nr:hypothetical protein [Sporosarcina sp. P13]PIC63150.1 hypothetical protein CSV79_13115 [Sporosarcina sp. P13]
MDLTLLNEMKERLGDAVRNGTNDADRFHVFAWEAGLGKSTHVNNSIVAYFDEFALKDNIKKFLIVKKFKSDVYETVEHLKQCEMLEMYGDYSVIGLTSENVANYSVDKIKGCMVLVITHQRYIESCDRELNHYFGDRDTLIIDEQIQFPIMTFGRAEYNDMRKDIHLYEGQLLFDKCCTPLLERLDEIYKAGKYNSIVTFQKKFSEDALKDFKEWGRSYSTGYKRTSRYKQMIKSLEILHSDTSEGLIHNDTLYLMEKSMRFRKLKNNIILDAAADISPLYNIPKQFKVVETRLCIDHSKSNVGYMNVNTSKSNLKKNLEYVINDVKGRLKGIQNKKKALLVCHKENSSEFLNAMKQVFGDNVYTPTDDEDTNATHSDAAIDWYGNIVGKNTYKDYDICLLLGTHNLPLPVYLLQSVQYSPNLDVSIFPRVIDLKSGRFADDKLELVRKAFLAADFYQAARRIQRNQEPKASYLIYTSDEDVVQTFVSKFNRLTDVLTLNNNVAVRTTLSSKDEKALRILEYIQNDCAIGDVITKKTICEALGLQSSNFSRDLKHELIANHVKQGHIEIGRTVIVKKAGFTQE